MNEAVRRAGKIYLDANVIIYFVEQAAAWQPKLQSLLEHAIEHDVGLFVSDAGIAECLYGAFKARSAELEARYRQLFFELPLFRRVAVDSERIFAAARLGAEHGLHLVDAIHFLAAMETGCEIFLTNDGRFRSSHDVEVVPLKTL